MKIKRKVFLIPFFLLISLLCNISKTYAYAYEDVTFNYDSIDFISLYNNYEIVEHIKEIVEEYNTHNFPVMIYFIHDENNANYLDRIGFGVDQRTLNSNTNFHIHNMLWEQTTPFRFSYDENLNTTNKNCYFTYYGVNSDDTQLCRFRTNLTIDSYTQSDLNAFYTNIQKMLTQYVEGQTNITKGGVTPHYSTNIVTQSYNIYDQNQYQAYVWSNVDLINKKAFITGYTNYITNTYFGDDLVPFDDEFISYDEYINSLVSGITFTSQSFTTSNDIIYKKIISIDYGRIDNELYDYYLLDTRYNLWNKLDLSSVYPIKTIDAFSNYVLYAEVRDKEGNVVTSGSYAITDIETDLNIRFEELKNYDVYGENYGNVIQVFYTSDNRSDYTYRYKILNLYSDFETDFINVRDLDSSVSINLFNSSVIYAEILDSEDNILYNASFTSRIDNEGALPRINFKDFKNLEYEQYECDFGTSCGHQCVNSLDIIIDYGVLDDSKYLYQYSFDGENWFDVSLSCNSIDDYTSCTSYSFNIINNELIIGRVINKDDNSVVALSTYQTTSIGTCNVDNSIDSPRISIDSSFKYFKNPIKSFLDLFTYFWNHLPSVLKLFFVFIFSLIVILFAFRFLL